MRSPASRLPMIEAASLLRLAICTGRHVTRGDLTVSDIAERFLVTHVEGHVTQLREILAVAR